MPDDSSLPYLGDITITPKLPSSDGYVHVAITWTVKAARPTAVEIYTYFGTVEGNLLDLGNRHSNLQPSASPITMKIPSPNHEPFLYIGVAPRLHDADGGDVDSMPDASGEDVTWDNLVTKQGMNITYTSGPTAPTPTLPPPNMQASSFAKTLSAGDFITATASYANSDDYNLIVASGGEDLFQQHDDGGNFQFDSIAGKEYLLRAERHDKGSGTAGPQWSPWSVPLRIVASPRERSLRGFLSISGVLSGGVGVRQYAAGSTRRMMGI